MQQFRAEPSWWLPLDWVSTGTRRDRLTPYDIWLLRRLRKSELITPRTYAHLCLLVARLARAEASDAAGVAIRQRLGADLQPAEPGWGARHFTTDSAPKWLVP